MQSATADRIFANEADPAFRRRARWIEDALRVRFGGMPFRLADIGCGRGFYFPLYGELNASVTGVELDPEPFAIAVERGRALGISVVSARAEHLPFEAQSVDAVVMSEILEHLDDPVAALAEAARILKPGGLLLATVPNANYPFAWDPINWVLDRTTKTPIRKGPLAGIWANHVRLYDRADLTADIAAGGFEVEDVVFHTHNCMPFVHNIVYGLGKPLLERRMLPADWAKSAERAGATEAPSGFNPVAMGIGVIHWFDRGNPDREPEHRSSLNICVSASKP